MYLDRLLGSFSIIIGLLFIGCGEEKKSESGDEKESSGAPIEATISSSNTYHGFINENIGIYAKIDVNGEEVSGTYYYSHIKQEIELAGTLIDGTMHLEEYNDGKVTGYFEGKYDPESSVFEGTWSAPKGMSYPFRMVLAEEDEYQMAMIPIESDNAMPFDEFLSLFEVTTLPFIVRGSDDENGLDSNTVKKYLEPEYWFETIGYEAFIPIQRYQLGDMHVLIVDRYYTPGAFGINNVFIQMYTVSSEGAPIAMKELGCYCSDTNMGANDYYTTDDSVSITEEEILVYSKHLHATLFAEEMEEGEEEIWEESFDTARFVIEANGTITRTWASWEED